MYSGLSFWYVEDASPRILMAADALFLSTTPEGLPALLVGPNSIGFSCCCRPRRWWTTASHQLWCLHGIKHASCSLEWKRVHHCGQGFHDFQWHWPVFVGLKRLLLVPNVPTLPFFFPDLFVGLQFRRLEHFSIR